MSLTETFPAILHIKSHKILIMTTHDVLMHHLTAFGNNDLEEILKDYTQQSELLTPNGPLKGLEEIQSFFEEYCSNSFRIRF